jgi:uncharacterized protein YjbJ (UPF0337 family)
MGQEDITAGKIKQIKGKANDIAGAVTGDSRRQLKGKLQQALGRAQAAYGKATTPAQKTARVLALAAILSLGFTSLACETSHTESDSPSLFGGTNHTEDTTTHNPITNTDDTTHTETHTP